MPQIPRYTFRFPIPLKEAIKKILGSRTMTQWIIEAIEEKLIRELKT